MSRAKKDKAARDRAANTPPKPPEYCNAHVAQWRGRQFRMNHWTFTDSEMDKFNTEAMHAVSDVDDDFWEITRKKE